MEVVQVKQMVSSSGTVEADVGHEGQRWPTLNSMHRADHSLPLVMTILLAGLPNPAGAEETGDIEAGHRLSEIWCSPCDFVGRNAPSGISNVRDLRGYREHVLDHASVVACVFADAARKNARSTPEPG
jgi:hypothetical protein